MAIAKIKIFPTIATGGCVAASLGGGYFLVKKSQKNKNIVATSEINSENPPSFSSYEVNTWKLDEYIKNATTFVDKIIKIEQRNIKIPAGTSFDNISQIRNETLENLGDTEQNQGGSLDELVDQQNAVDSGLSDELQQESGSDQEDVNEGEGNNDVGDEQSKEGEQPSSSETPEKKDDNTQTTTGDEDSESSKSQASPSQDSNTKEASPQQSPAGTEGTDVVGSGVSNSQNPNTENKNAYESIKDILVSKFSSDTSQEVKDALAVIQKQENIQLISGILEKIKNQNQGLKKTN